MFEEAWYKKLGLNYNNLITKLGKMKNGTYYVQGHMETYMELLSFLRSDLGTMLDNPFGDSYDFTGVVIVGRDATSALPEKVSSILARAKPLTTYDQPPNLLAHSITQWSEGEVVTAKASGTGPSRDSPPLQ